MRKCLLAVLSLSLLLGVCSTWAAEAPPDAAPAAPAPSSPPAPAPSNAAQALHDDVDRLLTAADLGKTVTAARVVALAEPATRQEAEVLYSLRADQPLIPASTMKLLTTGACLDRLGPDWQIRTHIGRVPARPGGGPVAGKKDEWDLAVIGGGDPNFSGRFYGGDTVGAFRQWADALKSRGLRAVGRIVLDDSLFDSVLQHPHWPADQRAEWYEAPASALSINDNCANVHVAPGEVGQPARVWLEPPGGYATVEGTILTTANQKEHSFRLERVVDERSSPPMRIRAGGNYWVKSPETIEYRTLVDPTLVFGAALAETLRAAGIPVAGPIVRERITDSGGRARPDFACDLIHTSRLDATVAVTNKRSQGFYAECLLKILGAYGPTPTSLTPLAPRQGNWTNGPEEVRRWLVERGIPADGCVMDDGSGLSKENRLTALCVTELLAVMYARHGETFLGSLAVAGQEGSLSKRMRNTPAEGRVFGKTGYVFGASALSGYVRSKSGRLIAYSILMNDVPWGELWKARLAQDKVCLRLVDY